MEVIQTETYDVIIIGGSYAGLSSGLALGRSRRKTLIIDAGDPCNKLTPHSHNFLTQDGVPPAKIASIAKEQVLAYPTVSWHSDFVDNLKITDGLLQVTTADKSTFIGRKLIIATGLKDMLPEIPGFKECWGKTIIHCPYCHGYEYRDEKTGIVASGEQAMEIVRLIDHWTKDLTLYLNGENDLTDDHRKLIANNKVRIVDTKIQEAVHKDGKLQYLIMEDGSRADLVALYARVPTQQKLRGVEEFGCDLTEMGLIKVDMFGRTTV
ncbi:MAG: NAD(P)/FAD-dependent oxidoreductase, partial [Cyclobacteriaceae bacterium]